jgi:hypothetical protein
VDFPGCCFYFPGKCGFSGLLFFFRGNVDSPIRCFYSPGKCGFSNPPFLFPAEMWILQSAVFISRGNVDFPFSRIGKYDTPETLKKVSAFHISGKSILCGMNDR